MQMLDSVRNYLYDKDYFIDISKNQLHVFRYIDLLQLTEEEIRLQMDGFVLIIHGQHLRVSSMNPDELYLAGNIGSLEMLS